MTRAWDEERRGLLEGLRRISDAGRGEGASKDRLAPSFYPVPEHLRMLDPDVVLVVGPRGSGKSLMARVLTEAALAQAVGRFVPRVRLPKSAEWVAAYPARRDQVFEGSGLKLFVRANGDDTDAMRDVWLAYLLRCLRDKLAVADQVAMQAL